MGRDKALIVVDGVALARRIADALTAAGADLVVVVGGAPDWAAALELPVVADRWPGEGPLGGLVTAMATPGRSPDAEHGAGESTAVDGRPVVVAACDQPDVDPGTIRRLLDALAAARQDAVAGTSGPLGAVPRTPDGVVHPFPSAWMPEAGSRISDLFAAGERRALAAATIGVIEVAVSAQVVADLDTPEALEARFGNTGRERS